MIPGFKHVGYFIGSSIFGKLNVYIRYIHSNRYEKLKILISNAS